MYGRSKAAPSPDGVQSGMWAPFGTKRNAIRVGAFALAAAPASALSGRITSSMGNAMAAPSPRRNVRRGKRWSVFIGKWSCSKSPVRSIIGDFVLALEEGIAGDDPQDQRRELVPLRLRSSGDRIARAFVVVFEAAP